ncbi:hypothetical protein ABMA28_007196 [Loxostege sticticalis]|uniref:Sequestosome-1 n=1 Tax=Loxostege sticticalis TaxID=481309 RepID=A0ABD0TQ94_LOXSC
MFQVAVPATFKVFTHWDDNSKPEVRRFTVGKSSVDRFHKLNEILQGVFPKLKTKTYSVTWKDEDGDDITISTDEELTSILSIPSGFSKVIKFNVFVNGDECDATIPAVFDSLFVGPANLCHRGVKCDGCDSSVVGFRYKCASCEDFDLCSRCEASGKHPGHCMVRIPSPIMPHAMIKSAIKKSRQFLKSVVNDKSCYRRPCKSSLGAIAAILNELSNLAHCIAEKEEKHQDKAESLNKETLVDCGTMNKEKETGFKFGINPKLQVKKDDDEQKQTAFPAWGFGAPPLGQTSTRVEEPVVLPPTTAANPQIGLFPPHGCFPRPGPKKPQFGAFGPAVMGPGGFAQPCVEGYPKQNPFGSLHAFASSNAFGNSIGFGTSNGYGTTFGSQQSSCVPFSQPAPQPEPTQATNSEPVLIAQPETVQITKPESTLATQPQPADPKAEPTLHHSQAFGNSIGFGTSNIFGSQQSSCVPFSQPAPQPEPAQATNSEPVLIAQPETDPTTNPEPSPAAQPQPAAPETEPTPHHPQPHIDQAIKQMLAMGFTNEGGWLTQLVESEDGDIAAVLEYLPQSVQSNNNANSSMV